MKVRFLGFELGVDGNALTYEQVLHHLTGLAGTERPYKGFNRVLSIIPTAIDGYTSGLFVTIKDQKRYCEIRREGGIFELVTRDLADGNRIADFNFFVINNTTRRGIYQYYHHSCSISQFLDFLERQVISHRDSLIDNIKRIHDFPRPGDRDRIDDLRQTFLATECLVRNEQFDQLLARFREIGEMTFTISAYTDDSRLFAPIRDCAQKRTERVVFQPNMVARIRQGIRRLVRSDGVEKVRVKGVTENGIEDTISLFRNLDSFGEYEYDDLTEHMNVDMAAFQDSHILRLLLNAGREHAHIFERL